MTDTTLGSIMLFSYMSMALLAAVFFRSQFKFLQTLFLPAAVLAGFFILITGPSFLNVFNIPLGKFVDGFIFHLITAVFIIIGLRGFPTGAVKKGTVGTSTILISKMMGLQVAVGIGLAILIGLVIPGLFAGFGSLLVLGFGFDPTLSLYFGGFWQEELAFANGRHIAYSFAVLGFLAAYILGLVMIAIAKKKGELSSYPRGDDKVAFSGIVEEGGYKRNAGMLTTGSQSIDGLSLHLAVIGVVFLLAYSTMRLIARWMVFEFEGGAVIVAETFMNFQFFFGFIFALLVRRLMKYFSVDYLLDEGMLNRSLGVASDYLVVSAIASIPLVISGSRLWEILFIVVCGAAFTYFAVILLSRLLFKEDDCIERRAVFFGFLTGNISSSVALLRVVDPELRHPVMRDISFAGVLSFILAIPLIYLINLPLIGEEVSYQIYSVLLALANVAVLYVFWTLIRVYRANREKLKLENE